ncbi:hypothetical protein [Thermoactinospora rubra]|uniref:hypothetical protein n=1 Tax=Thermoactinospora rubra TaxID=1088767 RepID=UPI000A11ED3F|nr:hypothetical protein [Thermoactinospora rubra]
MYDLTLPPSPDSIESAGVWARNIALAERPDRADDAERIARSLVSQLIPLTGLGDQIRVAITSTADGWLRIEAHTPGRRRDLRGGHEYAQTSAVTTRIGSLDGPEGHTEWAELPPQLAVTA